MAVCQLEFILQELDQFRGGTTVHFQTYGVTKLARMQFTAQCAGQVLDLFEVEAEVGITGDTELEAAIHLHAREQLLGKFVDDGGQEDQVITALTEFIRQPDQTRQRARCRDDGHTGFTAESILAVQLNNKVEALVHQARERMRRVQTNRADHRQHLVFKVFLYPGSLRLGPVGTAQETDIFRFQRREHDVVEDLVLTINVDGTDLADAVEHLLRMHGIRPYRFTSVLELTQLVRHPDFEKLVQIAGEDQQEHEPLQQRIALVQRLLQNPDIELQVAQFPVDVQLRRLQVHRHLLDGIDGGQNLAAFQQSGCGLALLQDHRRVQWGGAHGVTS